MQRDEIIRRLEELVPEIQESRDAEGTLLKFAASHNLAPAQLETLAQVYNTGKALTYYSKSANRGGTFKLVETEPLLEKYTDHVSSNNLSAKQATEKSASTQAKVGTRFPHFRTLEAYDALEKSASIADEIDALALSMRHQYFDKQASSKAREMAEELREERMDTIRGMLDDLKAEVRFDKQAFTRLEEDAMDIWYNKDECKIVFDKAADYLKRNNCDVSDYRYDVKNATERAVARDTTGWLSKMASVRDGLDFIRASQEFTSDLEKQATPTQTPPGKHGLSGSPQDQFDQAAKKIGIKPTAPKKKPKKDEDPKEKPKVPNPDVPTRDSSPVDSGAGFYDEDALRQQIMADMEGGISKSDKPSEESNNGGGNGAVMDSMLKGMLENKFKGIAPTAPLVGGKKLLEAVSSGKNTRQKMRDEAVNEDIGVTSLQRLMISDPILAEASPEEVLAHFNTINEIAPAVAGDPNKLRLPLREAVQYGSIPMHTLKELLEINKLIQGNQKITDENSSALYGRAARPSSKD